ncbi:hypothetical protein GWI72_16105 [Microvirga tunisiensis]|uniref:Uncharacterized protein n=2 Tax=Pannonibacter tanglangensis TaxID=2750084 RepID=A0ABW9ZQ89_9HYPH|nr:MULTISPECIES: hypothetical protein [unclassified Pannonibacter]NBN65222.1 hypothetical protein [Pannonibacter sp. XCT-34]NBN79801.1 hypothetical protein [Pannonibacter sp. XCT-53]
MTKSAPDDRDPGAEEEAPLDPAVLRVQTRLRRLVTGSTLIMVAGIAALMAAIVYKVNSAGKPAEGQWPETLSLGVPGPVEGLGVENGVIYFLAREDARQVLVRVDAATGQVLGRTVLTQP